MAAAGRIRSVLILLAIAWSVLGMAASSYLGRYQWLVIFAVPPWGRSPSTTRRRG
jgi:hypothetical protein